MDLDQMKNRIEWLDEERRNDKGTIADLQKKNTQLEELLKKTGEEIKDLSSEITHLNVVVTRIDSFDDALVTHRKDVKKSLDAQEKKAKVLGDFLEPTLINGQWYWPITSSVILALMVFITKKSNSWIYTEIK